MATVSAMALQRPKKMVRYGKASSRARHASSWLEDDEDDIAPPPKIQRVESVKQSYPVQKPEAVVQETRKVKETGVAEKPVRVVETKKHAFKPVKSRRKEVDAFDVPSSDDEVETEMMVRRVSPPRGKVGRDLVDDSAAVLDRTTQKEAPLAPWEKKNATTPVKPQWRGNVSPEAQLKAELVQVVPKQRHNVVSPPQKVRKSAKVIASPESGAEANPMSAAERLAARRQQANKVTKPQQANVAERVASSNKRTTTLDEPTSSSPRKRARKSPPPDTTPPDVQMENTTSLLVCEAPRNSPQVSQLDVFDFPADDEPQPQAQKLTMAQTRAQARNSRRGKLRSSSRSTPKKGLSAPARLAEMLPMETESSDAPSRSPSAPRSRNTTPGRSATPAKAAPKSTPPTDSSPAVVEAAGTLTPKQAQLWSQLLPSDPPAPSPSSLAMKELTLSGRKRTGAATSMLKRTLTKSSSDVPKLHRRRTRIVDRLRAAAPSEHEEECESSEEEEDDIEMEDVEFETAPVTASQQQEDEMDPAQDDRPQAPRMQSQSQSQSQAEGGPRITYATQRSYLPEDNLEDGLMLDLPSITPQRPPTFTRQPSKTQSQVQNASQKSAFDLSDSEDDAGGATKRMRTVHELRAAGRNSRFMQETEGLLEDISEHSPTARSRRRGAQVELGTKLTDKVYAERFVAQGFEQKLVAELSAPADEVADFLLASCLALILAAEPPEHTVRGLRDGGTVGWLAGLLKRSASVEKLVKDRKSNMAKAAQKTVVEFAEKIGMQTALWDEAKPTTMTARTVSLKALDLLVGKLRRLGDRSEFLSAEQLADIIPASGKLDIEEVAEISTSISLLEALSTSPNALAWSSGVLDALAQGLPAMVTPDSSIPRHTTFLVLRLTANLTNESRTSCEIFAHHPQVVQALLELARTGFEHLTTSAPDTSEEQQALNYDLLVLAMGCMINLAEHSKTARCHAITEPSGPILSCLITTLVSGQQQMEDADSLAESSTNVAYGYLAVMLANICQNAEIVQFVKARLPGQTLELLIQAVEEFVRHHQKVDALSFDGEEGKEVWGSYTERLKVVSGRLREVAGLA